MFLPATPVDSILKGWKSPSQETPVHLQQKLREYVWRKCCGTVQTGPFAGMRLALLVDTNLGTKTLGCYEQELHGVIEREIGRLSALERPVIINLGCAGGYYTVGLAMRLPRAFVVGVDIKPERFPAVHRAADLNGVRVTTVTPEAVTPEGDFILSDCEGAEAQYLDPERYPSLRSTVMLVETHDDTLDVLSRRFRSTHHRFVFLSEQMREPNQYPCLLDMHSHEKWLSVSENRPATHAYLYMVPKSINQ